MKTATLDALTRSLAGSFAFCGIAAARGETRHFAIGCAPGIAATNDTMFRVASVSKLVVGQAVADLVRDNITAWDADVSDMLGWPLRHPGHSQIPVTLGMVAAHHAGLADDAGYAIPADVSLQEWCQKRAVFKHQPGIFFEYANLGYIILAEILARLSGRSFVDAVARHLPDPAGFNWHGVTAARIARRLPTYRSDHGVFAPQIDADIAPVLPSRNPSVFSPQGGLRTSLDGMLQLAEGLRQSDRTALWTPQMGDGQYLDGVFECYGPGVQIFRQPQFYPRPLVGHFGNAYGFNGGVWYDETKDLSFAYALNGLTLGDESDDFSEEELQIFATVADL
ncbi:MAG: serine hydrolase domain-containing protein [Pseudomonadota bacterium]